MIFILLGLGRFKSLISKHDYATCSTALCSGRVYTTCHITLAAAPSAIASFPKFHKVAYFLPSSPRHEMMQLRTSNFARLMEGWSG